MCRLGVLCAHLAGVHSSSSSKDAGTDHPRSQVYAIDTGMGAGGLRYDLDLSLPQLVRHETWEGKVEKEKREVRE